MSRRARATKSFLDRIGYDPETTSIVFSADDFEDNEFDVNELGALGHSVGKNTSIREIEFYGFTGHKAFSLYRPDHLGIPAREWEEFFRGLSESLSIETVTFWRCYLGSHILNAFNIVNLGKASFKECEITRQTASAVQRACNLSCVVIDYSQFGDDVLTRDFIASLNHNNCLKHFELKTSDIGSRGCIALGGILSDPHSIIHRLELAKCEVETLLLLQDGLVNSSSLRVLKIFELLGDGWQVVSEILTSPATALQTLELEGNSIYDRSAFELTRGLAVNRTLQELDLSGLQTISAAGWLAIVSSLRNPDLHLSRIQVGHNENITDEVVSSLAQVFIAKKQTIKVFDLGFCPNVTCVGWASLSAAFREPMPRLTELYVGNANFNDDALISFLGGFRNTPSLQVLGMFETYIRTKGWNAFSRCLCDRSSLRAIEESHHILREIRLTESKVPVRVEKLLLMNSSGNPSEAARHKIVHYCKSIDIQSLVNDQPQMQLKLVPSVISWLGKHPQKHNALYRFIRNESHLLEDAVKKSH
ncbi:hypothetical protein HJC23_005824 [Cyclotella cryptica]|uniref:Uncharacterized protein n=1 Tax=Cyclotella cryptica TaxID=29204 RepID=A0ABD3QZ46_9STRA|eukprot:CCRYP_000327-RA/>CCRYP_000327-RA protein AED:0.02 eAED:0.02 QI:124/1/1/1/0/0/2/882/532